MSRVTFTRDRFRWTILALISVSHVIGATAQYAINTLAPFYQDELGLSRAQVGLFFSAFYLAMTSFSFGAGWLADHLGVQKTMLQGHLFLGVCTVAASLAPSFSWAFASFFLAGAGYSFLNPASSKGVMAWFDHDERATAMGTKQTGVQAGAMIGRIGWGVASDKLFGGRRKIVLIIIGLLSTFFIAVLSFMTHGSSLFLLLLILFLSGVCLVGYQGVSYALIGELAGKERTGAALGMMITINAACATLGTPLFGYLVDRTGSYPIAWQALAGALGLGIIGLATLLKEPEAGRPREDY